MFNMNRAAQKAEQEEELIDQRTGNDRRTSKAKINFPFVDDANKLVMKDRRVAGRREADVKKNPLKMLKSKLSRD
ncbi:MAG: hypothetical protein AAF304_02335 [Pseudomonadota bacterium]